MTHKLQPGGESAAVFRFGDFTFHCGSRLLTQNGVERHLSPKAQELLRLLLMAWPSAQSRKDLYDALWPSTFVCETNMAGVVSELRKALDDDARTAHYIRTVHGYGYAFCGEVTAWDPRAFQAATLFCEGESFPLYAGENSVGRAQDCRVLLRHSTVSRHHALIMIEEDEIRVQDLDSKNGTFVDGQKIRSARVTPKNQIAFGYHVATIVFARLCSTQSLRVNMPELQRMIRERLANA